jgi:DNA polymerase V
MAPPPEKILQTPGDRNRDTSGTSVLLTDAMEASMPADPPVHSVPLHPSWRGLAGLPQGIPLPLATVLGSSTCALASSHVAAGFPSPADDYVEARIDLNLALIPRPLSTFFMRVSGDAMAGDGILDGDLLVIDRSLEARPGLVVVATHDGAFIVRRLEGRRGSATGRLVASDGLSAPIALVEGEAELWGVVIHAVHHLAGGRPGRH